MIGILTLVVRRGTHFGRGGSKNSLSVLMSSCLLPGSVAMYQPLRRRYWDEVGDGAGYRHRKLTSYSH